MGTDQNNRTKWIHLRLSPSEYRAIQSRYQKTTCRNFSQYARAALLDRPIVTTYRNVSQDDLLQEMVVFNRELNAIGNNVNQSVKRLHTLQEHETSSWAVQYSVTSARLEEKILEAKTLLNVIAERWLR
ncbi:plasmid mobilization relaxosome protein MobC [Flavobacterium sp.]|uniref:plasmid mobilization protein n=1 Tax=Flavobacterium sp. TaxID=239 RepID=UPI0026262F14|nr:plasmid mobilization relaxosome protein MobC [Flavobacterium sp.]